jgi:tRNA nucleotidyltransferase/poly(A) polymerase
MKLRELLSTMKAVQQEIKASEPYICGGTPRDKYLKRLDNISDLDVTTGDKSVDLLSQRFAEEFKKRYNINRKTMEDGHSTIHVGNLKIDFSSNFNAPGIEVILNKQGIANPTEMQKEMFSRDFTCNALLLSLDLKNIIDPTRAGFKDIKEKKIKTCLSPQITLTSNKNRVIRAVYLASKLGFDIDQSIVDFVKKNPNSVRIATEKSLNDKLNEAFKRDADRASYNLTKMNIWNYVPITEIMYPYYNKHVKGGISVSK